MENNDISAVEKLHYLKMSLTGEPSQLLKNVTISSENLNRSWKMLIARYKNKRILIDAQLSALFAIRKLKTESSSELKRLLGDVKEILGGLEALDCPVRQWDHLIVFMTVRNLDSESMKDWEKTLGATTTAPSFADLETFLVGRVHTLEAIERSTTSRKHPATNMTRPQLNARSYATTTAEQQCALCNSSHYISACPKYLEKTPAQRRETVSSKNLCYNCLGPHHLKSCRNAKRCRICRKQHHSTLHLPSNEPVAATTTMSPIASIPSTSHIGLTSTHLAQADGQESTLQACSHVTQSRIIRSTSVLLATALVTVVSPYGEHYQVRALLDQGSEASFISESVAQILRLSRTSAAIPIIGIGAQRSSVSNGRVSFEIISRVNSAFSLKIEALVLPKLTSYLPPAVIVNAQWPHIHGLALADPNFATPGKIDLVLGAGVCAQILEDGICRGASGTPIAQKTTFGWILFGQLYSEHDRISTEQSINGLHCSLDGELLDLLQRFWAQEEITPVHNVTLTPEESQCEEHFKTTHSRDAHGRFIVRLPLRKTVSDLGDSRAPALRMLRRMEARFETHASLKVAYKEFLREYLELGHMRLSSSHDISRREFFLPHHGVIKETSSTTKLRVVFNGSQKTNLGISLNDCLHIGPKLQTDLIDILVRWRRHRYVFATDIEKMYRQIRVHPDDWPLQKIFWRDSPCERPREYLLCTVTYELACAPYLALRCLQQLATDIESTRGLAAEILRRDTYVDDILSGSDDISTTKEKMQQLKDTLTAGGFNPKKWITNASELLQGIPVCDQDPSAILPVGDSTTHYTLGIRWSRSSDSFVFVAPSFPRSDKAFTKRSVLSFIARIFDPLGWIAPIIITAKRFMQQLWAIRLDWDDELPCSLKSQWIEFMQQFEQVSAIVIPLSSQTLGGITSQGKRILLTWRFAEHRLNFSSKISRGGMDLRGYSNS
ncbi:uncharacterized protein LOC114945195 [Nylanderia fulva]|uniref:uncharacterized protein LOC114945195 n=1 Tax=Nylanderia fulva TaxID=613905 RepID=UPI0010FB27CB|nr:uncharacterized protein LOC114945195 [Nylanderia fulva]